MGNDIIVLECARKHGLGEIDVVAAIHNAVASRYRNFDIPCHVALAGPDRNGNLIEVLYAEQEDGSLIVYHAMRLTNKMARELDL